MFEFVDDFFTVKVPTSPSPPFVPARQWSFDNLDGLVLMEGTVQVTFNALTTGKAVNQYIMEYFSDVSLITVIYCNNNMKLDESDSFQVNNALITDRSRSQWIDLGVHTEACMTCPETCGATGGAVSFWVKLVATDCNDINGIISSYTFGQTRSTGFTMSCFLGSVR